jgi:hypothetical protein
VHVFALFPPLEHAPDQIASRPFVTLKVIDVPVVNDAVCELPVATFMPAGLDRRDSPLLPVAETVSEEVVVPPEDAGFRVNCADFVTPPPATEIVTMV